MDQMDGQTEGWTSSGFEFCLLVILASLSGSKTLDTLPMFQVSVRGVVMAEFRLASTPQLLAPSCS